MHFFKLIFSVLVFLSFNSVGIAQVQAAENVTSQQEFADIMTEGKRFCRVEGGILDPSSGVVVECIQKCERFSNIQAQPIGDLPSGKAGEQLRNVLAECVDAYHEVKRQVEAFKTVHPSISEVLNLRHLGAKSEVDSGYNQCLKNAVSTPERFSAASCLCTAKVIVNAINERGGYSRIHATFARLVRQCRGL